MQFQLFFVGFIIGQAYPFRIIIERYEHSYCCVNFFGLENSKTRFLFHTVLYSGNPRIILNNNSTNIYTYIILKEDTTSLLEGGIFKNINIDLGKATKELPDFDARSTITSKTFKGMNMTKKEKRKMKHDVWMKSKFCLSAAIKIIHNSLLG